MLCAAVAGLGSSRACRRHFAGVRLWIALPGWQRGPYDSAVATLEDLEARVAALEASQADYGAVLAAVNALGANQREHALGLATVKTGLAEFRQETRATS